MVNSHSILMYSPKFNSREMPRDEVGDTLVFMRKDFTPYAELKIKKIIPNHRETHSLVEFSGELPKELDLKNDIIMSKNQPSEVRIENSVFHSEGRVVLQCSNAVVENCEFVNAAGFQLNTCIAPWYEAAPSSRVTVRNNRFIRCGRSGYRKLPAVIIVSAEGALSDEKNLSSQGTLIPKPVHSEVEISGNTIDRSNNSAMIFSSVKNLTVKNNLIRDVCLDTRVKPWQLEVRDWNTNAVNFICGVSHAVFENNTCVFSRSAKKGTLAIGKDIAPAELRVGRNTGFVEKRFDPFPERSLSKTGK